ncbi:MAG: hypothetical protein K0R28_6746 [Paenibacillus sp.]|nr:hypothetical protein [Paenibacillus sp.]
MPLSGFSDMPYKKAVFPRLIRTLRRQPFFHLTPIGFRIKSEQAPSGTDSGSLQHDGIVTRLGD